MKNPRPCLVCDKEITSPGGPRTNTCSEACRVKRAKTLKRAAYERSKNDPDAQQRRIEYREKVRERKLSDPAFAEEARAKQRLANKRFSDLRAADAERHEAHKLNLRLWKKQASDEQKQAFRDARKKWYASLSPERKRDLITEEVERARRKRKGIE